MWGTDGRSVRDVVIAGQPVVRDGRCVTVDADAVWQDAAAAQHALLERAGITVPHRWPQIDAR